MKITTIDIQNFRKLKSCRIEVSDKSTIFVGANNSGKTSAMFALLKFLKTKTNFSINDITVTNWSEIEKIGEEILKKEKLTKEEMSDLTKQFRQVMPSLDIWLKAESDESHHVINLIPTLEWDGGSLGVRTILEIKSIEDFIKDYRDSFNESKQVLDEYKIKNKKSSSLELWPKNMYDFLSKKLTNHFKLNSYILDPGKYQEIQELSEDSILLDYDPFKGLIKIDSIGAQRGFSDDEDKIDKVDKTILSNQFTSYYNNHINPQEKPDVADIVALEAIRDAENTFDDKLKEGFHNAFKELHTLGYPGFNDPKITIETKIKPIDGLNHGSSVRYDVAKGDTKIPKLPERYNGLGYQNLISIVFKLIRFRDEWMKVGKIAKRIEDNNSETIPPLHLVLIEEPEAHLHSQVQQVFIRKAYEVLRHHKDLENNPTYNSQMIVSTHSSHIAHEVDFVNLRYFKKKDTDETTTISTTKVINLSDVFNTNKRKSDKNETARFITRYLKTTHCDIFFADAVILIEGNVERILLPHFIENKYPQLNESYISILEIGGRHSYRLRPLIEKLGIITLIITDLDTASPNGNHKKEIPYRNKDLISGNYTLKSWIPRCNKLDELIDLPQNKKIINNKNVKICVAYQIPNKVTIEETKYEVLSNTFEDSFVVSNLTLFKSKSLDGPLKTFQKSLEGCNTGNKLQKSLYDTLDKFNKKAEFALDLLYQIDPNEYSIPNYIVEGLDWLLTELGKQNILVNKGVGSDDKENA